MKILVILNNNYPEKDKNNEYNNIQDEKIDSSQ